VTGGYPSRNGCIMGPAVGAVKRPAAQSVPEGSVPGPGGQGPSREKTGSQLLTQPKLGIE